MFVLKLIPFRSDISLLISTCTCPHRACYRVVSLFSTSARCIVAFRISNPRNTISTGVFEMQNRQLFIALRSDLIIWGRFCQFSFLFAKLIFARRLYQIPSSFFSRSFSISFCPHLVLTFQAISLPHART